MNLCQNFPDINDFICLKLQGVLDNVIIGFNLYELYFDGQITTQKYNNLLYFAQTVAHMYP
jgi:hypothetical protein